MKKIVLDPGHGGTDAGAISYGLMEKNLNLTVAHKAKDYMISNYDDVEVFLTRKSDVGMTPDERVKKVLEINPNICISIHHNCFNTMARGAEVIHAHYDEYDDALALDILARLAKAGMPSRRAFTKLNEKKADWYYMIRRIWDIDTTAIITEGGFVDNAKDAALLNTEAYIQAEAEAIAISAAEFLDLAPKQDSEEQRLVIALSKLKDVDIINSPMYWFQNAKAGQAIKGEYARALIINTGDYIGKG